jgi:hypothetical protein
MDGKVVFIYKKKNWRLLYLGVGHVPPGEEGAGVGESDAQVRPPLDDGAAKAEPAHKTRPPRLEDPLTGRVVRIVSKQVHASLPHTQATMLNAVLRIRIHRIHMFFGLLDPDPDPLVRGMDPDPSIPSLSKNSKKILDFYCFFVPSF